MNVSTNLHKIKSVKITTTNLMKGTDTTEILITGEDGQIFSLNLFHNKDELEIITNEKLK